MVLGAHLLDGLDAGCDVVVDVALAVRGVVPGVDENFGLCRKGKIGDAQGKKKGDGSTEVSHHSIMRESGGVREKQNKWLWLEAGSSVSFSVSWR